MDGKPESINTHGNIGKKGRCFATGARLTESRLLV